MIPKLLTITKNQTHYEVYWEKVSGSYLKKCKSLPQSTFFATFCTKKEGDNRDQIEYYSQYNGIDG